MPEQEDGNKGVTIVGGGLVGSLLAVSLGQRGLRVHLHESRSDIRLTSEVSGRSSVVAVGRP